VRAEVFQLVGRNRDRGNHKEGKIRIFLSPSVRKGRESSGDEKNVARNCRGGHQTARRKSCPKNLGGESEGENKFGETGADIDLKEKGGTLATLSQEKARDQHALYFGEEKE